MFIADLSMAHAESAVFGVGLESSPFRSQRQVLQEWVRQTVGSFTEHKDTYAARESVRATKELSMPGRALTDLEGQMQNAHRASALWVVGYDPDERWSLAVLLSQLQVGSDAAATDVVLIAEQPAWALPVHVTDSPRLRVVAAGVTGRRDLIDALERPNRQDSTLLLAARTGHVVHRLGSRQPARR